MVSLFRKAILGLIFAAVFLIAGFNFSAYLSQNTKLHPLSKDENSISNNPPQLKTSGDRKNVLPSKVRTSKKAPAAPLITPLDFDALKKRFSTTYLQSEGTQDHHHQMNEETEAMERVNILRSLRVSQEVESESSRLNDYVSLYKLILKNQDESWLVQRQTLKNMNPLWGRIESKERNALITSIDLRARAHWRISDADFALSIWRQNAK